MHEEMDENKNETEVDTESQYHGIYHCLDCLFIIEILASSLLRRLNQPGTVSNPRLLEMQKNLTAISAHVQEMRERIREQTGEEDSHRHSVLWRRIRRRIKRALKEMQGVK